MKEIIPQQEEFVPQFNPNLMPVFEGFKLVVDNSDKLIPMAQTAIQVVDSLTRYQVSKTELEVVKVKRSIIIDHFKETEMFIRLAFQERDTILKMANDYINHGIKENKPELISAGLELIKAIILANPYDAVEKSSAVLKEKLAAFESKLI